nr:hypothetical protein [Nitrosomonas nitrosa]
MTNILKLFNSKDLKKMRVQNPYRLTLMKLESLLIFHAGQVELNGDRYTYNKRPVVKFNAAYDHVLIELISPYFPDELLLPEEHSDQSLKKKFGKYVKHLKFRIGSNCSKEYDEILAHVNSINEQHIFRDNFVVRHSALQVANVCGDDGVVGEGDNSGNTTP